MRALLVLLTLSSCCTSGICTPSVMWMLGTPLESGTYVVTACVDEDCDETTVTIFAGESETSSASRAYATKSSVSLRTDNTDGVRGRLDIKREGELVLSDLRSLSWMKAVNGRACVQECPFAVVALE